MDREVASTLLLSLAPGFTPKHLFSLVGLVAAGRWSRWARKGDAGSATLLGGGVQVR